MPYGHGHKRISVGLKAPRAQRLARAAIESGRSISKEASYLLGLGLMFIEMEDQVAGISTPSREIKPIIEELRPGADASQRMGVGPDAHARSRAGRIVSVLEDSWATGGAVILIRWEPPGPRGGAPQVWRAYVRCDVEIGTPERRPTWR